jgi:glutamate 5-kinase
MATLTELPRRIVIKLGTGILTTPNGSINNQRLIDIASEVKLLSDAGIEVIVVSSGAIGLGMDQMGIKIRPTELAILQSCAAVGQSILTEHWRKAFQPVDMIVAQILLTREDIRGENRSIAVRNTLDNLLSQKIVPIINENDTISYEEIKFGDNDILSAMVGALASADLVYILSSIPGLMDLAGDGKVIEEVGVINEKIEKMAEGTKAQTSVGGMISKIEAAKVATEAGTGMIIGDGSNRDLLPALIEKKVIGTYFHPKKTA